MTDHAVTPPPTEAGSGQLDQQGQEEQGQLDQLGQLDQQGQEEQAQRIFSQSILISGIRCTLAYVVFPFVAPLVGIASGVTSAVGIVVGVVAIVFNVLSIRRFWKADHRWKWPMSILNASVIVLLLILFVIDLNTLT